MFVGALEFDILFGDVHSLKEKRSMLSPILTELRRFGVSAAEAGSRDACVVRSWASVWSVRPSITCTTFSIIVSGRSPTVRRFSCWLCEGEFSARKTERHRSVSLSHSSRRRNESSSSARDSVASGPTVAVFVLTLDTCDN